MNTNILPTRNTSPLYSRITSLKQNTSPPIKQSSSHYGIQQAKKNMTAYAHSPTQKQIFSLFASPSTAPTPLRMSWTKYGFFFLLFFTPLQRAHVTDENNQWYPEVLHFCPTTPLILVGLKSDLRHKRACIELLKTQGLTPVTQEQGQKVARQMGAIYMECSSKEMSGVHEVFELAIDTAVRREMQVKDEREQLAQHSGGGGGIIGSGGKRGKKRDCRIL